jgi:hypothetical protein
MAPLEGTNLVSVKIVRSLKQSFLKPDDLASGQNPCQND